MKSTTIPGPFDYVDYDDKVRIQCMVPETFYIKWFKQIFPRRGAQDKIISSLLTTFFKRCEQLNISPDYATKNEKIAKRVLAEFESIPYNHDRPSQRRSSTLSHHREEPDNDD